MLSVMGSLLIGCLDMIGKRLNLMKKVLLYMGCRDQKSKKPLDFLPDMFASMDRTQTLEKNNTTVYPGVIKL